MTGGRVWVAGIPRPKGSLRCLGRGRHIDDNPHTREWMDMIIATIRDAGLDRPMAGPVFVQVSAWFPRPASHFGRGRNADRLKPSAPVLHQVKPDADKIARAVLDALGPTRHRVDGVLRMRPGVVLADDAQVSELRVAKWWCDETHPSPGASILWEATS